MYFLDIMESCRNCGGVVKEIIRFDKLPLSEVYYTSKELIDSIAGFRMTIVICQNCGLIQLKESMDRSIHRRLCYIGSYSESYVKYLKWLSNYICDNYAIINKKIIELESGDGYLLSQFALRGNKVLGYESSCLFSRESRSKGVMSISGGLSKNKLRSFGFLKVDLVIMRHVLEYTDNFKEKFDAVNEYLDDEGLLVIECLSLEQIVKNNDCPAFFHESVNYFSELTLAKLVNSFGYSIIEKKSVSIHGGSILFILKKGNNIQSSDDLSFVGENELANFCRGIPGYFQYIKEFVNDESRREDIICGYGASPRTAVTLAMTKMNNKIVKRLYDSNPLLQGRYVSWGNIEIVSPGFIEKDNPQKIIIFASHYEDEIAEEIKSRYENFIKLISINRYPHYIQGG